MGGKHNGFKGCITLLQRIEKAQLRAVTCSAAIA